MNETGVEMSNKGPKMNQYTRTARCLVCDSMFMFNVRIRPRATFCSRECQAKYLKTPVIQSCNGNKKRWVYYAQMAILSLCLFWLISIVYGILVVAPGSIIIPLMMITHLSITNIIVLILLAMGAYKLVEWIRK